MKITNSFRINACAFQAKKKVESAKSEQTSFSEQDFVPYHTDSLREMYNIKPKKIDVESSKIKLFKQLDEVLDANRDIDELYSIFIRKMTKDGYDIVRKMEQLCLDMDEFMESPHIHPLEIELKYQEFALVGSYAKQWIADAKIDNVRNPEIMNNIQMIFQDPIDSLDPRMTVREIIAEGMIINGEKDQELITKKVNDALELVGLLPDHAGRYPHEFSGGQRQRIGIARALVINPEVIIADEPISALDVSIQAQVINLLNDLREKFQLTIVFIAHNLSVVKYFCDRIGVMYFGRLVEIATAEELFAHPLHPYTKSLLSAVPLPDPIYEKNRKRIFYNPRLRPRTEDKPQMVEITPGHFVYASKSELERYTKELNGEPFEPDPTLTNFR